MCPTEADKRTFVERMGSTCRPPHSVSRCILGVLSRATSDDAARAMASAILRIPGSRFRSNPALIPSTEAAAFSPHDSSRCVSLVLSSDSASNRQWTSSIASSREAPSLDRVGLARVNIANHPGVRALPWHPGRTARPRFEWPVKGELGSGSLQFETLVMYCHANDTDTSASTERWHSHAGPFVMRSLAFEGGPQCDGSVPRSYERRADDVVTSATVTVVPVSRARVAAMAIRSASKPSSMVTGDCRSCSTFCAKFCS
jgi:hypothetical protein